MEFRDEDIMKTLVSDSGESTDTIESLCQKNDKQK